MQRAARGISYEWDATSCARDFQRVGGSHCFGYPIVIFAPSNIHIFFLLNVSVGDDKREQSLSGSVVIKKEWDTR